MIAEAADIQRTAARVEDADPGDEIRHAAGRGGRLKFYTAANESIELDGWYRGRSCFLVCGGPSLADANLGLLKGPGIVSWGINNSWSVIRPNFWTCCDPADKFCIEGWLDPAITKVVPLALARNRLRYRKGTEWVESRMRVQDCPAVWFWARNNNFEPADFLCQSSVCWGNSEGRTDCLGISGMRSTMLATIRLVHAFGFRKIYLVGADFRMEEGTQNYAFPQERTRSAIKHNRRLFSAMSKRLDALRPYLEMEGTSVFNCTPGSALEVFPFKRLSEAVRDASRNVAGPMRTEGYYDKAIDPREEYAMYHADAAGGD